MLAKKVRLARHSRIKPEVKRGAEGARRVEVGITLKWKTALE